MNLTRAPIALALCTALTLPNVAFAAPPPTPPGGADSPDVSGMSDEDRMARAKELYGEADAAFKAGSFTEALQKFEEAYNVYAPSLHVFNINIGQAAHELGDCVKARAAFQRFLDLVPEHPGRKLAQEKLLEIDRSGCADQQPTPTTPATETTPTTDTTAPVLDDTEDAPILSSRSDEREEAAARERRERDKDKKGPLIISGAVLTAIGGLGLIGGGVSAILADRKAEELADLASPNPNTGFPAGDYSDEDVFNTDRNRLPANNNATIALFVVGGALTITGVALLVVGITRKKKEGSRVGDTNARRKPSPRMVVGPSFLPRGGGAAATVRF